MKDHFILVDVAMTTEDVSEGVRRNCRHCPTSLALARAVPNAKFVEVLSDHALIHLPNARYRAELPSHVRRWICHYDRDQLDTFTPTPLAPFQLHFD